MTVPQLKKVLTEKGLDSNGKKQELIDRIEASEAIAPPKSNGAVKLPLVTPTTTSTSTSTSAPKQVVPTTKPAEVVESKAAKAQAHTSTIATTSTAPVVSSTAETKTETESPKVVSLSRPKQDFLTAKQQRAEKFGVDVKMSDEEKRKARTSRFGVDTTAEEQTDGNRKRKGSAPTGEDPEKLNARAKKFGGSPATDPNVLLKRAKKFGTPIPAGVTDPEEAKKRLARANRFKSNEPATPANAGQPQAKEATPAPTPAVV